MSVATFISRILGLIRDMLFAFYFGTSWTYDVYLLALLIPQFLRKMFAEGALSSSAIPIMVDYKEKKEEENFLNSLFTYSIIFAIIIVIVGVVFSKQLLTVFATGIINEPEKMALAIKLTRIMFPFIGFISVASLVMGLLNSYGIFFPSAFAPSILNLSIIVSMLIGSLFFKINIIIPAIAFSLGGFLQLIYQLFFIKKTGYKFSFNLSIHPGVKKVLKLFWPTFLSYGISQINSMVDLNIASWLPSGAISSLQYAMRLFQLPIGVFAVSFSTSMLPRFSKMYIENNNTELRESLKETMSQMAFFIFPIVIIYLTSGRDIITIIFGHGKFNYQSVEITSKVLIGYSIGIIGYSFTYLFTRFFTGMKDTKTPMKINIISVIINIILDIVLVFHLKQVGLALATSISGIFSAIVLYLKIDPKLKEKRNENLGKITILSLLFFLKLFIQNNNPYINIFIIDSGLLGIYLFITKLMGINYLSTLLSKRRS